jgi:hypothetical protein
MRPTHVIACASLLAIAGQAESAHASVPSDEWLKEGLRNAICQQNWQQAVTLSGRLAASSTITPEYRQQMVDWRQRFSGYAASGIRFDAIPNCGEAVAAPQLTTASKTSAPASVTPTQTVSQLKADLKQAICDQNWNSAVALSNRLMASDLITAENRQQLVTWRYQFSQYATSRTYFDQIPNCAGATTAPLKANSNSLPLQSTAATPTTAAPPASVSTKPTTTVTSRPATDAACFITYADGRTVNLEAMCR